MFKRTLIGALVAGSLTFVSAEAPYITPVNYPTPMPVGASYIGVITNIDPVNRMIQLRDNAGMVKTVYVNDQIYLRRNGAEVSFQSITIGETLTIVSGSRP